jgi:uncharacterized membrane protein
MTRARHYILATLLIALATHLFVVYLTPKLIMSRVMGVMSERAAMASTADPDTSPATAYIEDDRATALRSRAGWNTALPARRADASSRTIVKPSPDLLYTACLFDLSEAPLQLTGPVTDSYASLSGFADNTDNFFAINDSSLVADATGRKFFNVVLRHPDTPETPLPAAATLVESPSTRGIVLFRTLIPGEDQLDGLYRIQAQQRCEPVS